MTNLKYDVRDNTICWETPNSSDFIELRPYEDGPVIIDMIEALAVIELSRGRDIVANWRTLNF